MNLYLNMHRIMIMQNLYRICVKQNKPQTLTVCYGNLERNMFLRCFYKAVTGLR